MRTTKIFPDFGRPEVSGRTIAGAIVRAVANDGQVRQLNNRRCDLKERPEKWRLLTASEIYRTLGYKTPKALRLAAQLGFVPRVMIGKRVLFDPDAIKQWAAKGGTPLIELPIPAEAGANAQ